MMPYHCNITYPLTHPPANTPANTSSNTPTNTPANTSTNIFSDIPTHPPTKVSCVVEHRFIEDLAGSSSSPSSSSTSSTTAPPPSSSTTTTTRRTRSASKPPPPPAHQNEMRGRDGAAEPLFDWIILGNVLCEVGQTSLVYNTPMKPIKRGLRLRRGTPISCLPNLMSSLSE